MVRALYKRGSPTCSHRVAGVLLPPRPGRRFGMCARNGGPDVQRGTRGDCTSPTPAVPCCGPGRYGPKVLFGPSAGTVQACFHVIFSVFLKQDMLRGFTTSTDLLKSACRSDAPAPQACAAASHLPCTTCQRHWHKLPAPPAGAFDPVTPGLGRQNLQAHGDRRDGGDVQYRLFWCRMRTARRRCVGHSPPRPRCRLQRRIDPCLQ